MMVGSQLNRFRECFFWWLVFGSGKMWAGPAVGAMEGACLAAW